MRATKAAIKIIATPISTTMKFVEERGKNNSVIKPEGKRII
jgi:hypothetical protein